MTVLRNEVLEKPRLFKGETFEGITTLAYDAKIGPDNRFENCRFHGPGIVNGSRALLVPVGRRPLASFHNCVFQDADKLILGQWIGLFDCDFHDGEDAVFLNDGGHIHQEGGTVSRLGGMFGAHSDGFQSSGGGSVTLKLVDYQLVPTGNYDTNSCVFLESQLARVSRVSVIGCRLRGGNYGVYVIDGTPGFGPPVEIRLIGNQAEGQRFGPVRIAEGARVEQRGNSWQ